MSPAITCYACADLANSREHSPPRCLFPESKDLPPEVDLRKNLISVPSCTTHNSERSRDDEYLMWILALPVQGNAKKQAHFQSKGLRAFKRRPDTFIGLLDNLTPIQLKDAHGQVFESASFEVNLNRFDRCMWKIAIALFHHETGEKWLGGFRVFTDAFVELKGKDAEQINRKMREALAKMSYAFRGAPVKGENQEVFTYSIVRSAHANAVMMRFYEGIKVVVLLSDA